MLSHNFPNLWGSMIIFQTLIEFFLNLLFIFLFGFKIRKVDMGFKKVFDHVQWKLVQWYVYYTHMLGVFSIHTAPNNRDEYINLYPSTPFPPHFHSFPPNKNFFSTLPKKKKEKGRKKLLQYPNFITQQETIFSWQTIIPLIGISLNFNF